MTQTCLCSFINQGNGNLVPLQGFWVPCCIDRPSLSCSYMISFVHTLFNPAFLDPKTCSYGRSSPCPCGACILGVMLSRHELKSRYTENPKPSLFALKDLQKVVPTSCLVLAKLESVVRVFSGSCQHPTTLQIRPGAWELKTTPEGVW